VSKWKEPDEVRLQMLAHDLSFKHSSNFQKKHPNVLPRMRSILLDWMMEVCEAYTLHRHTFYLAQDYLDRFMMTHSDVGKGTLQLVGITCLFIAAKMEETRSPKLSQMVYVTADTYTKKDVIQMELIILKHLRWQLSPETPLSWVDFFLQIVTRNPECDLYERQFSVDLYLQITRLLDLCTLSINAMDYRYEVLAASVLARVCFSVCVCPLCADLPKPLLQPCINWMAPFAQASFRFGKEMLKDFGGKTMLDKHTIQTHSQYLHMMVCFIIYLFIYALPVYFPTPPSSTEKMSLI
uniref:G2/mitotic-specific cyclin-B2 n=1 Tax=Gouania willdenowi TaxID=441366 RepID=A0A8C5EJV8_GOUWI